MVAHKRARRERLGAGARPPMPRQPQARRPDLQGSATQPQAEAVLARAPIEPMPQAATLAPHPPTPGSLDLSSIPTAFRRALTPDAPPPLRMMAAKGLAPGLKPDALLTLLAAFCLGSEPDLRAVAEKALAALPTGVVTRALGQSLQPAIARLVAGSHCAQPEVVSALLASPATPSEALEAVAEKASEPIGELVAASDDVLLRFPRVIEKLYLNRQVRMSTADRLVDLAVRNGIELSLPAFKQAAEAIGQQLIAEPTGEPTFDDQLFQRTVALSEELDLTAEEDTHDIDFDGQELLRDKYKPLHAQISDMTISQKIRCATLGRSPERLLLVRDPNRLVATAAAQSPLLNESDAARIAGSRNVIDDVLRIIARNREFTRSYQIKLNLVSNPRTPLSFSSRLVPHLRDGDIRQLARSKGVPAAVRALASQQLKRKQQRS